MSEQPKPQAQPDRYNDPSYCQALEQERDYLRARVARLEQVHAEDVRQLDRLSEAENRYLKAEAQLGNQAEAADILRSLISNIESRGPYSVEATCVFLGQALVSLGVEPATGMQPDSSSASVPDAVKQWFKAKLAHVDAVEAYNQRLAFVRQHMEFGTSVEPEYRLMEQAERRSRELLVPMFNALRLQLGQS